MTFKYQKCPKIQNIPSKIKIGQGEENLQFKGFKGHYEKVIFGLLKQESGNVKVSIIVLKCNGPVHKEGLIKGFDMLNSIGHENLKSLLI